MASTSRDLVNTRPQYGFKIAKAGFNVQTATDYELLFNSSWPSLAIAYSTTVTTIPGGVGHVSHPLGFPPFTMAWVVENGIVTRRHFPQVSDTTLYFTDIAAINATYFVECYNLDISKQATYAFIAPPPAQLGVYDNNYGVKFAKSGKSPNSKDLNDFIFHSRAQSPALLAVVTDFDQIPAIGNAQTITYSNPQNYIPWAFGYEQDSDGIWTFAQPYSQAIPRLFINLIDNNSFTLTCSSTASAGSLIMLRDPLFVAQETDIIY